MHLPASVRVEYGGTYQEQQKSFAELARVLLMALVLVFGVLLAEFRNLRRAGWRSWCLRCCRSAGVIFGASDHGHRRSMSHLSWG